MNLVIGASPVRLFAASAVNVDFDLTFVAQFVIFTAFVIMLKPVIFDPLIRVWEERERRIDGARLEAREMDAEAGQMLERYEAELQKVRTQASSERERLRSEATRLEAKIMSEARDEAARIVDDGKRRTAAEVNELRADLAATRPALAKEVATKILGREVA